MAVIATTTQSPTATATINIVRRSITQVAPEGVVLNVTLDGFDTAGPAAGEIYDNRLHDIYYYWDFQESYTFAAPINVLTQFKNSRYAVGAKVSHVFRTPGTHTVTCVIYEPSSGKSAIATLDITVGDPDTLYAGDATIFVDNGTSTPSTAPAGAQTVTTLGAAYSLLSAASDATLAPKRIMLARDQTHAQGSLNAGNEYQICSFTICAAPGSGEKPIIDYSSGFFTWDNTGAGAADELDCKVVGATLQGGWDTTTQSGTSGDGVLCRSNPPIQFLFDACTFDGFNIGFYPFTFGNTYTYDDFWFFFNDTVATNWRSCHILAATGNFSVTGCRLSQNVDALSGYSAGGNNLISPVRFETCPNVIFSRNDLFSRTGWVENTPGRYTTQPCFRGNTSRFEGAYYNVSENSMEGGFPVLAIEDSNALDSRALNATVERNILVATHDSGYVMRFGYGGNTVRNNIGIMPDVGSYVVAPLNFVRMFRNGTDTTNVNSPQKFYNNTFVNLLSDANAIGGSASAIGVVENGGGYTDVTNDNNVVHQPNQGQSGDAPLRTDVLWQPRYTHYQDDVNARDDTKATPAGTVALYQPLTGSAAIGDATTGQVALSDFFGITRPDPASRGATEP